MGFKGDNLGSVPLLIQVKEGDAGLVQLPLGLLKLVRFTISEPLLNQFTQLLELLICKACEHIMYMYITNNTDFFLLYTHAIFSYKSKGWEFMKTELTQQQDIFC